MNRPQRTTKSSGKLVVLHEPTEDSLLNSTGISFSPSTHIRQPPFFIPTSQRQFSSPSVLEEREKTKSTIRITAYCTAENYRSDYLFVYLSRRNFGGGCLMRRFDEAIYHRSRESTKSAFIENESQFTKRHSANLFSIQENIPTPQVIHETADEESYILKETFYMDYGVVVLWGYEEEEEREILKALSPFEMGKLPADEVEVESLHCRIGTNRTPKIFNDM
jgi:uncharacterized Rmd1/YagE family protein